MSLEVVPSKVRQVNVAKAITTEVERIVTQKFLHWPGWWQVSVWDRFEESWGAVLSEYKITAFHAKDAMACQGQFARWNSWDEAKVERLIWDLWKVIGRFRAVKIR
jgi:hypothetical protein